MFQTFFYKRESICLRNCISFVCLPLYNSALTNGKIPIVRVFCHIHLKLYHGKNHQKVCIIPHHF
nr:MAG TPA: hypothetical protein [Bacteriophage sp.]